MPTRNWWTPSGSSPRSRAILVRRRWLMALPRDDDEGVPRRQVWVQHQRRRLAGCWLGAGQKVASRAEPCCGTRRCSPSDARQHDGAIAGELLDLLEQRCQVGNERLDTLSVRADLDDGNVLRRTVERDMRNRRDDPGASSVSSAPWFHRLGLPPRQRIDERHELSRQMFLQQAQRRVRLLAQGQRQAPSPWHRPVPPARSRRSTPFFAIARQSKDRSDTTAHPPALRRIAR